MPHAVGIQRVHPQALVHSLPELFDVAVREILLDADEGTVDPGFERGPPQVMMIGDVQRPLGAHDGGHRVRLEEVLPLRLGQRAEVLPLVVHHDHTHGELGGMKAVQ